MDPVLYHAHHSRFTEDLPFWSQIAFRYGDTILELGSGTGRVTKHLALEGFNIIGLDNNHEMLSFLIEQLEPDLRTKIQPVVSDMTNFNFATRFNTIICPCNTLSTLPLEGVSRTLSISFNHLVDGGAFAVSLPNPELLMCLPNHDEKEIEDIFPHPLDSEPVQVSSNWEKEKDIVKIKMYYDHLLPNGVVNRNLSEVIHTIIPTDDFMSSLFEIGYSTIDTYGDFDFKPFTNKTPYLVLVATR